jgi:succinate dehydrogenase / fumarate reductase cytochrome b subunit
MQHVRREGWLRQEQERHGMKIVAPRSAAASFWRARLGTILAVVPLSVWTAVHLWNNPYAFVGAEAWQERVTSYPSPLSEAVTMFVVLAPLLYHAVWGLRRIAAGRPNLHSEPNYANLKFVLQRLSALGVLLFIGAHLWKATVKPRLTVGHPEPFSDVAHEMRHHTPTLVVYLLGTLGVSYHLANGLETALMKFGMRGPLKLRDRLELPFLLLFLVLLAMSWAAIYALWAAG